MQVAPRGVGVEGCLVLIIRLLESYLQVARDLILVARLHLQVTRVLLQSFRVHLQVATCIQ